ncbi:MAG: allophanate hydrolase [Halomonadaceae bacterium]|nr:MAG: allophanate hydrolase [Halomonadaceae bacterium]
MPITTGWTLTDWQQAYSNGETPAALLKPLLESLQQGDPAWISLLTHEALEQTLQQLAQQLQQHQGDLEKLPLYGVPFAIKDNIDASGFSTTAACPDFAYEPSEDAVAVARLKAAGAVPLGKTNLDQFATGLVGTRSPYGAVPNTFNPTIISGGSSSGSASVVARGLVPFALGTDTAGSGRVPAGLNNLVGLKPTRGAISIEGVVPACRSLDCVSIFTHSVGDASLLYQQLAAFEPQDPFSRERPKGFSPNLPAIRRPGPIRTLGIPADPDWFGCELSQQAWETAKAHWQNLGITLVPTDFQGLNQLAALLYEGPWVAERHAAIEAFMAAHSDAMNPVVRGIISKASKFSATDTFKAQYQKEALIRAIDQQLADLDGLLVPTAPISPTLAAVEEEPVLLNSRLGTYTNFVNLADFCALALPAGFRDDDLPFGITLISGAWRDGDLQQLAVRWMNAHPTPIGATEHHRSQEPELPANNSDRIQVAVVGAHLTGMPLNVQLTERHARLLEQTTTSPRYRLYALPDSTPPKPGLRRTGESQGQAIIVEVWEMATWDFGSFVGLIPPPLGIGNVELADGRWVKGFICEDHALAEAQDITHFGGWRAFREAGATG